ncbi:LysR family transcriptional regulator [Streptomyces sp. NPDC057621]|uniref:LysR family transcriptional regulator n=1 Tax=Streptomyces liliiviolaceus TaxID=2823109 RepID=A0A941BBN3_9ACTN|nr:LysR family transcriptional regulator [Streptomyces liliiviolaceus]MBQ0855146.1 LysR family transcriptional regulator [Streptomyces liliiviolaceus]
MTLTQLRAFVTVARLGSVKGAAQALGVTEAAVSGAVAVLRRELGDVLFIRAAGGISLTPGGSRLAAGAAEIVGLAEETRHRVRQASSGTAHLRVASTEAGVEQVLPALLTSFGRRQPDLDVETLAVPVAVFGDLLRDRRADVTIGPAPRPAPAVESIPFLRFQLAVVAAPDHPLKHGQRLGPAQLAHEPWLLGPAGLDPDTLSGAFLAHVGVEATGAKAFPSVTASLNAVAAGAGLSVAFLHVVRDDLRRGSLIRLDVTGARLSGMLYASALIGERRSTTAAALCRFVTTPAATQAVLTRSNGVPMNEFRPPVHVTIWS